MNRNSIFVTGISGGLGFAIGRSLLTSGNDVIGISRGTKSEILGKLGKIAKEQGTIFISEIGDFEDLVKIKEKLVNKEFVKITSTISHLIISHGMNFNKSILDLNTDQIEKSMRVNFSGPFLLAQHFLKIWRTEFLKGKMKTDHSIVYISSVATKGGSPDEVAYHSAKRAMESAMLSFAREGAKYGIRANVISPGLMDTEMGKKTLKDRPDVLKRIPLGRLTGVEEISKAILFLINSPSTTGQNLHINGGRYTSI